MVVQLLLLITAQREASATALTSRRRPSIHGNGSTAVLGKIKLRFYSEI